LTFRNDSDTGWDWERVGTKATVFTSLSCNVDEPDVRGKTGCAHPSPGRDWESDVVDAS